MSYALYNMVQSQLRRSGFALYNEVWESTKIGELLSESDLRKTVAEFTDWTEDDDGWDWLATWRNRIAFKVRLDQVAAGIPIRTIQEAIDAGEYDVS